MESTYQFEKTYWWFKGLRAYAASFLDRVAWNGDCVVLEAGCGTGGNFELMSHYGKVFALDFMPSALLLARSNRAERLVCASITHIPFPNETFDLISSFDVLTALDFEHEAQAMSELYRVLKPGGHVFFNLAALQILWGKQDVSGFIKVRYNHRLLRRQLEEAGFRIRRLSYAYAFSFPAVLAVRLADRYLFRSLENAGTEGDFSPLPAPLNRFLAAVAQWEAKLLRFISLPFGSSIMALAQKPRTYRRVIHLKEENQETGKSKNIMQADGRSATGERRALPHNIRQYKFFDDSH